MGYMNIYPFLVEKKKEKEKNLNKSLPKRGKFRFLASPGLPRSVC